MTLCAAAAEFSQENAVDLELWTQQGTTHSMRVVPGSTTAGDLRRLAAEETGVPIAEVRLAYAGLELPLSGDGNIFTAKPGVTKMFAMRRAAAGAPDAPSSGDAAAGSSPEEAAAAAAAKEEPPPSSLPTYVTVQTMDGTMFKVPLKPTTTAGDIRRAVAATMGASASEVRLAYAGGELDPSKDSTPFKLNPKITVMHCTKRMKGGTCNSGGLLNSSQKPVRIPSTLAAACGRRLVATASSAFGATSSSTASSSRPLPSVTAPGSGKGSVAVQLAKQFRHIMRHPTPGMSVAPDESDEMTWHIKLAGPDNTPYAGGWFSVELRFKAGFPGNEPNVRFMTPIWHPNITPSGHKVCVDFGDDVRSVACVLSGLQMLLAHPNPSSPLNSECAAEMLSSPSTYVAKARSFTAEHAM
ncbi:ubiquitin-conjugating enzyme/RWD-like protein [Scenedesmus sp. NREL 46B-D3]|nr:ubiquitin-conjugating enzyme/RWD-like protein [Scenedesmus sp. NREL 46B-D3]